MNKPTMDYSLLYSYFDFAYAEALLSMKDNVMKKHCFGCAVDHLAHECDMLDFWLDENYMYELYLDEMLEEVNTTRVFRMWENMVHGTNVSSIVLDNFKLMISNGHFLSIMKTEQWKRKILKIMKTIRNANYRLFL